MLPLDHPERIKVAFDDHRLVANAGLLLPATLALRLGMGELADRCLDLGCAPGRVAPIQVEERGKIWLTETRGLVSFPALIPSIRWISRGRWVGSRRGIGTTGACFEQPKGLV